MNKLEGVKIYLSGGIDRNDDDGITWRKEFRKKCKSSKLPVSFFDPTNKPKGMGSEIEDEKLRIQQLLRKGKWNQSQQEMKTIQRFDLRMVDHCHLFIIYIDLNIHYCGSYREFDEAAEEKKPILAIMSPGYSKYDIPSWLVATLDEDEVFEGIDSCIEHLKLLNQGKILLDNRWIII